MCLAAPLSLSLPILCVYAILVLHRLAPHHKILRWLTLEFFQPGFALATTLCMCLYTKVSVFPYIYSK